MTTQSAVDVASYVLKQFKQPISTMKLQKLVFLAHGWSLALAGRPLIQEGFEAWRYGPVCRELYSYHRGSREVGSLTAGDPERLDKKDRVVIHAVVDNYRALGGLELSDLTHREGSPWHTVRRNGGFDRYARSSDKIPDDLIRQYYESELLPN